MTMALTDEQQTIVSHFTRHMPPGVRATYETQVREMLKQNGHPVSGELGSKQRKHAST